MFKSFLLTLLFVISARAQGPNVKISVSLSPAGDFVAETENVIGNAVLGDNGVVEASNIRVDVKSLKSGISLRDNHMINKYLEAAKYPEVILKIGKGSANKGEAILVIKGKEGKVSGTYATNSQFLKAEFKIKLSDFGITDINYKGIGVEDEIKVVAVVPLVKKVEGAPAVLGKKAPLKIASPPAPKK